ncbi:MAG: nuclear transport factor 2 family protein [Rhodoferax sp.]|nr:nuclear transport factor 2 family protein [Rhodoferax sp.]MDP3651231.1 nuclear transport factor 2 family protein [Rhodoferax sp.]
MALEIADGNAPAKQAAAPSHGLQPAVAASVQKWHRMVAQGDLSELGSILHPKAVFRSPMAHTPYASAQAVQLILGTVVKVFEDFTYHRELASADGLSVVLEFSANVDGKALKGIDMVQFDTEGKIVEFEVMVRPMSGLQALGDEMGKRLAPYLSAYKAAKAQ